jgi:chromosome segregation protein
LAEEQNNLEVELSQANRCLNEAQELIQQQQIKQQKFSTEHQSLSSQKQRMTQQLQQLMQRQTALVKNLEQLKPLLEELETESATLKEKIVLAETTLEQTKNLMIDGEKKLRDIEARRQTLAQSLELLRQNHSKHQIQAEHAQTKSSGILEQFSELDLVLTEVSNNLPDTFSEEASQTLLEQTQSRITRLGAINLAAINELDEQNERKQFIDAQYDDLAEALNTLESAIQEIDQETKEKFQETFNTVNNNFQYLFPKIFGGGQAYLSLTSDDLLDTGVIVFAQPPGKRNSSIHLLSGGEKALTALALVFGIFELNPSPFCMLDEVDAPLDDANVGRFCNLVQAMAEKTQFIVVTHNKVAMEMAHHLMGVTMQEPGVSRLVAVDVEAAIALASAHELAQ